MSKTLTTEQKRQAEIAYGQFCNACKGVPGFDSHVKDLRSCFRCQNKYCCTRCYLQEHYPGETGPDGQWHDGMCKPWVKKAPSFIRRETRERFGDLVELLNAYKPKAQPKYEYEIEQGVVDFLVANGYVGVQRQDITARGRHDIDIRLYSSKMDKEVRFVIELKNFANAYCASQLDKYGRECDGLILMCWHCSVNMRRIFEQAKQTAKIPVELVVIQRNLPFL